MEDSKRFSKMALFDSRKTLFYPWRAFIWLLEDNWREISFPRWLNLTAAAAADHLMSSSVGETDWSAQFFPEHWTEGGTDVEKWFLFLILFDIVHCGRKHFWDPVPNSGNLSKAPKNGIFLKNVCLLSLLLLGQLKLGSIFPDLGLRTLPGFHFLSKFYLSWFFTSVNNRRCSRRREM